MTAPPTAIALRVTAPGTLQVDTGSATFNFNRATFTKIAIRSGAGDDTVHIEDALSEDDDDRDRRGRRHGARRAGRPS